MVEVVDKMPKISVIMPVYNSAEYLHLAVESVRRQSLKDWELLLIDDGSSDESELGKDLLWPVRYSGTASCK